MFYAGILAKHQTTMHAFCMHFFIYISHISVTMNALNGFHFDIKLIKQTGSSCKRAESKLYRLDP